MRGEGLPTQVACRVLGVSESGFYEWRTRPPSARSIRHAWLTDLIHQIHQQSRGRYGAPRVHAELRLGYGITVGHNAVAMLMRRAGLQGLSGSRGPRRRRIRPVDTPADLVDRNFARYQPDQQWVTDVAEHPTRDAKVYCAVVLDAFQPPSRRLVHRPLRHLWAGHLRPGYGYPKPPTGRADGDPLRPRHPLHVLGVHGPGPPVRARSLDGISRGLLRL